MQMFWKTSKNPPWICLNNLGHSCTVRGLGTTRAESCYSSFAMNNRIACWGLSRLPSLTSFSGLWKCLTIPLMASPTPSWIWPVFNSGWEEKGKQRCCKTIQADTGRKNPHSGFFYELLCFLTHAFCIFSSKDIKNKTSQEWERCCLMLLKPL